MLQTQRRCLLADQGRVQACFQGARLGLKACTGPQTLEPSLLAS